MGKKVKNKNWVKPQKKKVVKPFKEWIDDANIGEHCTELMKIFGANINLARHLPLLIDSLKPVERRILYTMYVRDAIKKSRKVASIVGSTMDMYHPHGDAPIYECIVRMSQSWNNLLPLIEGQGNFGSIAGDSAAASRYIECKLSKYAQKCFFEEFDPSIVDMKDNYTGEYKEPEYLVCRYPNILVNFISGIGFGIAVGIPSYNFKEALELTIKLIRNPKVDAYLVPDVPTGCLIVDDGSFKEICDTGRGKIIMMGAIEADEKRHSLIIKSTPYQVSLNDVKDKILSLHDAKKIPGIVHIKDNTGKDGMALSIYIKREIDLYDVMDIIYKKTQLRKTLPVQFKAIDNYRVYDYNLKGLILEWINNRRSQKRRIFSTVLNKMKNREHILEILLFILNKDNVEKTLKIIKKSNGRGEIVRGLVDKYNITTLQANTIADMRLSAFSSDSYERYKSEKNELSKKIPNMEYIIKHDSKLDEIIIDELKEGIELFGEPRRCTIVPESTDKKIKDTNHLIVVTNMGKIKKLPANTTEIGETATGDYPVEFINVSNLDELFIFIDDGTVLKIPVHTIRNTELTNMGVDLTAYTTGQHIGNIVSVIKNDNQSNETKNLIFATRNGNIKKTEFNKFLNIRSGLGCIILKDNDKLISAKLMTGDNDIIMYTGNGYGIRFNTTDIRETGRLSVGVIGMVPDDEFVEGVEILDPKHKYVMAVSSRGFVKKFTLDEFGVMARNSKPLKIMNVQDDLLVRLKSIKGDEVFKVYCKTSLLDLDVNDVPELKRLSRGKKLLSLGKGNYIIDILKII